MTSSVKHLQTADIITREEENNCNYGNTLAPFIVYSSSPAGAAVKNNGYVQAN